jgi:hypothetical protein
MEAMKHCTGLKHMISKGFAYETHKHVGKNFIPTAVGCAIVDDPEDDDSEMHFFPFKFCPCCGVKISDDAMPDDTCESNKQDKAATIDKSD